ncbi:hypothetical protein B0J13DRAFT_183113 [Dactylonectria estremocensis]|uniref:Uncharacterized protein n=1 Tax=Dactylonectria estremocensis TaxID=1079267 RepID=A0A9P9FAV7_9HYPO|nr:hypothetical protein B0J13DRAFT_183113 [Dactylonectria estremocensis]
MQRREHAGHGSWSGHRLSGSCTFGLDTGPRGGRGYHPFVSYHSSSSIRLWAALRCALRCIVLRCVALLCCVTILCLVSFALAFLRFDRQGSLQKLQAHPAHHPPASTPLPSLFTRAHMGVRQSSHAPTPAAIPPSAASRTRCFFSPSLQTSTWVHSRYRYRRWFSYLALGPCPCPRLS